MTIKKVWRIYYSPIYKEVLTKPEENKRCNTPHLDSMGYAHKSIVA